MLRSLLFLGLLGIATYGFIAYATGNLGGGDPGVTTPEQGQNNGGDGPGAVTQEKPQPGSIQGPIRQGAPTSVQSTLPARGDALIVPNARVTHIFEQTISSEKAGLLKVLGVEVAPGTKVPEEKLLEVEVGFLAIKATPEEVRAGAKRVQVKNGSAILFWRRWKEGDDISPDRMALGVEKKYFQKLEDGTEVKKGQLLGVVSPKLVMDELQKKLAELKSADAKRKATNKTMAEAKKRYDSIHNARQRFSKVYSDEEERGAFLTYERYSFELVEAEENLKVKGGEIRQTATTIGLHEVRSAISGVVTQKFKRANEAVKEQDPVLRVTDLNRLRTEGVVSIQEARAMKEGDKVLVEFARPVSPILRLPGHLQKVNGIAVTKGAIPSIVSASDDGKVRVTQLEKRKWGRTSTERWFAKMVWVLPHYSPVHSVTCSPAQAEHNLCLTGTADGVGRIWNLAELNAKSKPVVLSERHEGAINAVAFSHTGQWCATGGDDRSIRLWETKTGKLLHALSEAHRGAVTHLQFTPNNELLSVGRDNQMVLRKIENDKKRPAVVQIFENRSGHVDQLGVSRDGKHVLLDKGGELRIQTLPDNNTVSMLQHDSQGINFSTLALFSPDGQTILTGSTTDEHVQLWRNPVAGKELRRPAEIRKLIWEGGGTTCAAFAPEASFVVTGTQDRNVLIWDLPAADEVEEGEPNATISFIDPQVDAGGRVRIWADLEKKPEGLKHGMTGRIIVYPE